LERYKTEDDSAVVVVDGSSILPKGIRHERPTLLISHIFLHRSRGKHLNNEELSFIDGIITEWRHRFSSDASVKKEEEDEAAGKLRPSEKYGYVYGFDNLLRTMISQDYEEALKEAGFGIVGGHKGGYYDTWRGPTTAMALIGANVDKQEEEEDEEEEFLFPISATREDEKKEQELL
jgi:hypothetical protein